MDIKELKIFACEIIQDSGILLQLPQAALTTAQMLLHRVYCHPDYSMDKYPLDITAMAALFLAAKVEEYPRKASVLIDVFTYVISTKLNRRKELNFKEHEKLREELITTERRLLKNVGFNLLSNYPHKILMNYYHVIVNTIDPDHNVWKTRIIREVLQVAWNFCNDSLRTDVFLRFSKEAVVCACIQMACERTHMLFPKTSDGREWYLLFTNESDLKSVIDIIGRLYDYVKPNDNDLKRYLYLSKI